MTSAPVDQTVRTDGIARFVCVGIGSLISISWEYHEVCGSDGGSCEVNEEKMQSPAMNSMLVNSTLTINTSVLGLQLGRNYSIQCILHQNVPGLQGENQTVSTRLVVTPTGNAMTVISASFCYCQGSIQWGRQGGGGGGGGGGGSFSPKSSPKDFVTAPQLINTFLQASLCVTIYHSCIPTP